MQLHTATTTTTTTSTTSSTTTTTAFNEALTRSKRGSNETLVLNPTDY